MALLGASLITAGCGDIRTENDQPAVAPLASVLPCSTNVVRRSPTSPLLTNPKVYLLFWTDFWRSQAGAARMSSLVTTWSQLAGTDAFYRQMGEYGIGMGQYLGASVQTPPVPFQSEAWLQTELVRQIDQGATTGVPANDPNTLYIVFMPFGMASSGSEGHHGYAMRGNSQVWYGVVEYRENLESMNRTTAHEIYEAVTDPDEGRGPGGAVVTGTGWRPVNDPHGEIADLCEARLSQTLRGFVISRAWSQALCDCPGAPAPVLEHIALRNDGKLWESNRLPTELWTGYAGLAGSPAVATDVEMQNVGGSTTHAVVVSGGTMLHGIRNQSGTWGWNGATLATGISTPVVSLGLGEVGSDLHLCVKGADEEFYHGVLAANGSFSGLADTFVTLGDMGRVFATDCSGFGSTLRVITSTNLGIFQAVRNANGSWARFERVSFGPGGRQARALATANVGGVLHVVAITDVGSAAPQLWHNLLGTGGVWAGWTIVPGSGAYRRVSAAALGGELHVVASASLGGDTWHLARHGDGTWTAPANIKVAAGSATAPGVLTIVTATGASNASW